MASPTYAAPISIDGPPPAAPALTLVGASRIVPTTDDKWINGAALWPYPTDLPDVYDACLAPSSSGATKIAGTPTSEDLFGSFAVLEGVTCTTRGIGNPEDWKNRVKRVLEAREHWGIEHEFWAGSLKPDNPHLAQSSATLLNSGTSVSMKNALALLEQEIAEKGGDGIIHLRPTLFSTIEYEAPGLLEVSGGVARTKLGTPVVPGVGYPGTSPAAVAATSTVEWAYVTGRIEMRRSEIFGLPESMAEATDRSVNTTTFRAERYVLVTWDRRIHAAVKVDRTFTGLTS